MTDPDRSDEPPVAAKGAPASQAADSYVGTELELFRDATNWKAYFARHLAPALRGDVLEVGAGMGGTTGMLCRTEVVRRWVCLEPDARLCQELGDKIAAGQLPACCEVQRGSLADLPDSERFDAILYVDVLEHIRDDRDELAAAARRLEPGGRLVVLSPAYQWLFSPFDEAIGHFRRYSRASLRAVAPDGLACERLRYLDSVGVLASAANRLLMRQGMPTPGQLRFWDRVLVPLSRLVDPLVLHGFGKTVIGIWRKPD